MRSLFVGLMAAVLCIFSAGAVIAQAQNKTVQINDSPAAQKGMAERVKQRADIAKGDKRAVAAEEKLKAETTAVAPKLLAAGSVPCTVTGSENHATFEKHVIVEVSCQDGFGYVLVGAQDGSKLDGSQDCIPAGTPLPIPACTLAGNANPAKALQPYLAKSGGSDCVIDKARELGRSPRVIVYEVACASGTGEILSVNLPRTAESTATAALCYKAAVLIQGAQCNLTTAEANIAPVKALATKGDNRCPLKDQRYVGATTSGSEYFEYACQDGSGYMIQANAKGEYMRNYPCIEATGIAGGCKLSDTSAAMAAKAAIYTTAAKGAGFACDVDKFEVRQKAGSSADIAEISCKNRPDSAIAIIDAGKTVVLSCPPARAEGYVCSLSKPEDSYAVLTEHLKTQGRNTCVVNGSRPMGAGRIEAYVEVTCADGGQGFVVSYPLGTGKPNNAIVCSSATSLGGGCTMPGNKKDS